MDYLIAKPRSTSDIEMIADRIRETLNLKSNLYFPVINFIENVLTNVDAGFNYEYVSKIDMPPNTYAYYNSTENVMYIRDDVYDAACMGDGRHRFTLAHEIGHYLLHSEGVCLSRSVNESEIKPYLNPEWQANTFASALLMPRSLIKSMTVKQIADECGTSFQAASIAYKKSRVQ